MPKGSDDVRRRIAGMFADAGAAGRLHAVDIDTGREVAVLADEPVAIGSVFKLPLVLTLHRLADAGVLDLTESVTLGAARTGGPTGVGAMRDPVTMSLRDLAHLAISVSDNAAADALGDRVGFAAVADTVAGLGLRHTVVSQWCRDIAQRTVADLGSADPAGLTDPSALSRLSTLDPLRTNRSTARDCTALLAAIWRDTAASPHSCAAIRRLLSLQIWPHRLAAGFPYDDIRVYGKTGTLPTIRNEIGVAEYPDGGRYAVAVFTRSESTALTLPRVDAVVGATARAAVEHLRLAA